MTSDNIIFSSYSLGRDTQLSQTRNVSTFTNLGFDMGNGNIYWATEVYDKTGLSYYDHSMSEDDHNKIFIKLSRTIYLDTNNKYYNYIQTIMTFVLEDYSDTAKIHDIQVYKDIKLDTSNTSNMSDFLIPRQLNKKSTNMYYLDELIKNTSKSASSILDEIEYNNMEYDKILVDFEKNYDDNVRKMEKPIDKLEFSDEILEMRKVV